MIHKDFPHTHTESRKGWMRFNRKARFWWFCGSVMSKSTWIYGTGSSVTRKCELVNAYCITNAAPIHTDSPYATAFAWRSAFQSISVHQHQPSHTQPTFAHTRFISSSCCFCLFVRFYRNDLYLFHVDTINSAFYLSLKLVDNNFLRQFLYHNFHVFMML